MPQTTLHEMNMAEYLQDPQRKQCYVTKVFEIVAPSYDRFTRWCRSEWTWPGNATRRLWSKLARTPASGY